MQYIFTFSSAEVALIYFQKPCINVLHARLLCIVIDDGNMDCWLVKDIVENLDLAITVLEVYVKILQLIVFILRTVGGTKKTGECCGREQSFRNAYSKLATLRSLCEEGMGFSLIFCHCNIPLNTIWSENDHALHKVQTFQAPITLKLLMIMK